VYLAHLSLADFRSYPSLELPLPPGPSVFLGSNGQGKTNLLEAVHYLATLSSHRVAVDAPLVRAGAGSAVVRASVVRGGRPLLVEVELRAGRANRARLNRVPVARPREVLGALRAVLFAPEDLAVVKGDPAERRRYLDDLLTARAPRYTGVRADYDRVLRQRNALLKTAGGSRRGTALPTLDVWDGHVARLGGQLLAGRLELVETLRPLVDEAYASLGGDPAAPRLDYRTALAGDAGDAAAVPAGELAERLLAELAIRRAEELDRGLTLVGPHRDDLLLYLGELPARGYGSHGECWSLALALRLAAYDLLRDDGQEPVLLLDDVFAELDAGRRDRLAQLVGAADQLLVTAAVAQDVPAGLVGARYEVADGRVCRVG
jgi:DNA replication and repair protein RecF